MVLILSIFDDGRWDPYSKFTIFFMDGWSYAEKVILGKSSIVLIKKESRRALFLRPKTRS